MKSDPMRACAAPQPRPSAIFKDAGADAMTALASAAADPADESLARAARGALDRLEKRRMANDSTRQRNRSDAHGE